MAGTAIAPPGPTRRLLRPAVAFVAAAALSLVPIQPAIPGPPSILPQGGSVAAGHATIGAASNNSLTVNQGSQNAVINWNSFSIGQPNTVTYHQPNAASATLNRVTGNTPSSIAGRLNANGQIYLVNPNGIAITKTGAVKVSGGFVGSTLGTDDGDFMNGKRTFKGNGHSASVSNAGSITVGKGGFVGLIGGTVSNSGTIRVPLGKVALGSGESVTLDVNGDGFMQVAVPTASKAASGKGLVDVSGRISAAGGTIELQAVTLKQAIRNAVNVSGTLSARSLSGHSGSIVLGGGAGGDVNVSGRLNVSAGRSVAYAASVKSVAAVRNAAVAGRRAAATKPALAPANGGTIAITGAKLAIADKASLKTTSQGAKGGAIERHRRRPVHRRRDTRRFWRDRRRHDPHRRRTAGERPARPCTNGQHRLGGDAHRQCDSKRQWWPDRCLVRRSDKRLRPCQRHWRGPRRWRQDRDIGPRPRCHRRPRERLGAERRGGYLAARSF